MEYQIYMKMLPELSWEWFGETTYQSFETALNDAHKIYQGDEIDIHIVDEQGTLICSWHSQHGEIKTISSACVSKLSSLT